MSLEDKTNFYVFLRKNSFTPNRTILIPNNSGIFTQFFHSFNEENIICDVALSFSDLYSNHTFYIFKQKTQTLYKL